MKDSFEYDYLIVGSGIFGAVFAYEMQKRDKKCLVIDKRHHIGGNVFTKKIENIDVHLYGPHIFHTNDKNIWDYINSFAEFNNFINSPLARCGNKLYNLPFNMNTFYQMWGCTNPEKAKEIIEKQISDVNISTPENLEEQAINMIGSDLYNLFIKGYTQKQWGRHPKYLPPSIIKRIPVRYTFNNNYFNDKYQGIPVNGYTEIIEKMLDRVTIKLGIDYFKYKSELDSKCAKVLYTGPIDQLFEYQFGKLEYRSLRFEHSILDIPDYQGNAIVNYSDIDIPFTRIIEHKHFNYCTQPHTVLTKEYPANYNLRNEPFYPINDEKNNIIFKKYESLLQNNRDRLLVGGRLGKYKYYDMHQVIASSLKLVKHEYLNYG
jgi:UDP-galactopyranose mutase